MIIFVQLMMTWFEILMISSFSVKTFHVGNPIIDMFYSVTYIQPSEIATKQD